MNVFAAISDPTRRAMLDLLTERPMSAGEIGSHFAGLTQPGVSKHLGVLRRARLVHSTVSRQQRVYSLDLEGFAELREWIRKYQRFWGEKLDSLESYLDSESAYRDGDGGDEKLH